MSTLEKKAPEVSNLAQNIIGSEIIKLNAEVNELIKKGIKIYNLTIGDFDANIFPIPEGLKKQIISAYESNQTNYPPADGILDLRKSVSKLLKRKLNLDYNEQEILISGGARPIIYSIYRTLVNPGEKVIFAVPSWNNNHYTYLVGAQPIVIETLPEQNFMPLAKDIKPHIQDAAMIAVCSPQNPTGTIFKKQQLAEIIDIVLTENKRRMIEGLKPLYVMYDQVYWELVYNNFEHYNPVSINPEMKKYTIFVDGVSKSLSATGVRVGWGFGPTNVISKMKSILTHIGAWAPKPEQVATAKFMDSESLYDEFVTHQKNELYQRLKMFYTGIKELHAKHYPIDVIEPQAALYLTVKISLKNRKTKDGKHFASTADVTKYILEEGNIAVVPFYAFGSNTDSDWYRFSVGTCSTQDIPQILKKLEHILENAKY